MKNAVAIQYGQIEARNANGEFDDFEDLEPAFDRPLFEAEFASESILLLLNSHIERQLFYIACQHKKIKPHEYFRSPSLKTLIKRIGPVFEIQINQLSEWPVYMELRERVNALKHGSGMHDPTARHLADARGPATLRYTPNFDDAERYLELCQSLTRKLWSISARIENAS